MLQRAGGPERLLRLPVPVELEVLRKHGALAEVDADQVAQVPDADVDRVEPRARELADDDLEDRPVADREQRLGQDRGVGPQAHAEPACEDDGSHRRAG